MRSVSPRLIVLASCVGIYGSIVACSSSSPEPWELSTPSSSGSGGSSGSSRGSTSSGSDSGASGSGSGGQGTSSSGSGSTSSSGSSSGSTSSSGSSSGGTVTSADGFDASRTVCINTINQFRAGIGLPAYTLENTVATNTCVDTQATNDEKQNSPHYSFINNAPSCTWGQASGFAQDECPTGWGTTPDQVVACLQSMWAEGAKPNCLGCVGCTAFGGACANCDYSGAKGYECGHYVNMSAPYFTSVACGFGDAAPSSSTGWSVQDFQ